MVRPRRLRPVVFARPARLIFVAIVGQDSHALRPARKAGKTRRNGRRPAQARAGREAGRASVASRSAREELLAPSFPNVVQRQPSNVLGSPASGIPGRCSAAGGIVNRADSSRASIGSCAATIARVRGPARRCVPIPNWGRARVLEDLDKTVDKSTMDVECASAPIVS